MGLYKAGLRRAPHTSILNSPPPQKSTPLLGWLKVTNFSCLQWIPPPNTKKPRSSGTGWLGATKFRSAKMLSWFTIETKKNTRRIGPLAHPHLLKARTFSPFSWGFSGDGCNKAWPAPSNRMDPDLFVALLRTFWSASGLTKGHTDCHSKLPCGSSQKTKIEKEDTFVLA